MKNSLSISLVTVTFLFSIAASALIAGPAKIAGTVRSFDDKVVSVENDENKYEVPKAFVAEKSLKAGNKIEIILSQEQAEKVKVEKKKISKK